MWIRPDPQPSGSASASREVFVNGVVFAGDLTATLKAFDATTACPSACGRSSGRSPAGRPSPGELVVVGAPTAASDLCAKGAPGGDECAGAVELTLGSLGGVHAFRPATIGGLARRPLVHFIY